MPIPTSLVTISPQPSQPALNFIGATVVENKHQNTIDITIASTGIPGNRAKAYNSSNTTLSTGVVTVLTFDTNVYDTNNIHPVGGSKFTVPVGQGGIWLVYASGAWANVVTGGTRIFQININGVGSGVLWEIAFGNNDIFAQINTISSVFILNDGDFVEFVAFQATGGNLNVNGGPGGTFLGMVKLQ